MQSGFIYKSLWEKVSEHEAVIMEWIWVKFSNFVNIFFGINPIFYGIFLKWDKISDF